MPIDASIPLGVKPAQFATPKDLLSLQALAQQNRFQGLQTQQLESQMQERDAVKQAVAQGTDPQTGRLSLQAIQNITSINPQLGGSLYQQGESMRLRDLQNRQQRDEVAKMIGTSYVKSYDDALATTGGNKQAALMQAQQQTQSAIEEMQRNGTLAAKGLGPEDLSMLRQLKDPETTRSIVMALGGNVDRPKPQSDLAKLKADADRGLISPADYKAAVEKKNAPTSIMLAGNEPMDDKTLGFMAEQYLAGDRQVAVGLARNPVAMVQFRKKITEKASELGMGPKAAANAIAEFEGAKAGQRAVGTRTANIEIAANEAYPMADLALQASNAFGRSGFTPLNKAIKAVQSGTGDPNISRFVAANNSFINAYARAIAPTGQGPTVSDKDHAREMLNTAMTQIQYSAVIDQLKKEMEAALSSPGTTRKDMRERFVEDKGPQRRETDKNQPKRIKFSDLKD